MAEENKSYTIHKSKKSQVDVKLTARESLKNNLANTSHRLDLVKEVGGVEFICDTKAIDLLSTRDSFKCITKPIIWLAASTDHDRDYALIEKYVKKKVKAVVVYGDSGDDMKRKLGDNLDKFGSKPKLEEAIDLAYAYAEKGDVVIFSPSCKTEDEYNNYSDRGLAFTRRVNELIAR
jgi:UDP-N-acetylmuramoylalanine--D-glutamate ligase